MGYPNMSFMTPTLMCITEAVTPHHTGTPRIRAGATHRTTASRPYNDEADCGHEAEEAEEFDRALHHLSEEGILRRVYSMDADSIMKQWNLSIRALGFALAPNLKQFAEQVRLRLS